MKSYTTGLILFFCWIQMAHAEESIFQEGEHCLAYRTVKKMFFLADVDVVGKSCQVKAQSRSIDEQIQFEFEVPVRSLDSDNGQRDEHVVEILKGYQHFHLRFRSQWMSPEAWKNAIQHKEAILAGELEVRGKTFPVDFPLRFVPRSGHIQIEGKLVTRFSAFQIEVPTVGPGGMIADVSDDLEIWVQLRTDKIPGADALAHSLLVSEL